jgi:hypothetical protein
MEIQVQVVTKTVVITDDMMSLSRINDPPPGESTGSFEFGLLVTISRALQANWPGLCAGAWLQFLSQRPRHSH